MATVATRFGLGGGLGQFDNMDLDEVTGELFDVDHLLDLQGWDEEPGDDSSSPSESGKTPGTDDGIGLLSCSGNTSPTNSVSTVGTNTPGQSSTFASLFANQLWGLDAIDGSLGRPNTPANFSSDINLDDDVLAHGLEGEQGVAADLLAKALDQAMQGEEGWLSDISFTEMLESEDDMSGNDMPTDNLHQSGSYLLSFLPPLDMALMSPVSPMDSSLTPLDMSSLSGPINTMEMSPLSAFFPSLDMDTLSATMPPLDMSTLSATMSPLDMSALSAPTLPLMHSNSLLTSIPNMSDSLSFPTALHGSMGGATDTMPTSEMHIIQPEAVNYMPTSEMHIIHTESVCTTPTEGGIMKMPTLADESQAIPPAFSSAREVTMLYIPPPPATGYSQLPGRSHSVFPTYSAEKPAPLTLPASQSKENWGSSESSGAECSISAHPSMPTTPTTPTDGKPKKKRELSTYLKDRGMASRPGTPTGRQHMAAVEPTVTNVCPEDNPMSDYKLVFDPIMHGLVGPNGVALRPPVYHTIHCRHTQNVCTRKDPRGAREPARRLLLAEVPLFARQSLMVGLASRPGADPVVTMSTTPTSAPQSRANSPAHVTTSRCPITSQSPSNQTVTTAAALQASLSGLAQTPPEPTRNQATRRSPIRLDKKAVVTPIATQTPPTVNSTPKTPTEKEPSTEQAISPLPTNCHHRTPSGSHKRGPEENRGEPSPKTPRTSHSSTPTERHSFTFDQKALAHRQEADTNQSEQSNWTPARTPNGHQEEWNQSYGEPSRAASEYDNWSDPAQKGWGWQQSRAEPVVAHEAPRYPADGIQASPTRVTTEASQMHREWFAAVAEETQKRGMRDRKNRDPVGGEEKDAARLKTVFVGDLPTGAERDELMALFERHGVVEELRTFPGKNYAFVVYACFEHAERAIRAMDNHMYQGNYLRVARGGRRTFCKREWFDT
eukprot:Ihof_evm9s151 gene=Ihof_evmTU9s151